MTIDLVIKRPAYTRKNFESEFLSSSTNKASKFRCGQLLKSLANEYNFKNFLGLFSIFNLIATYDVKKFLINDIISVGVLHIPTSLAYGAVTTLNPIHGLYSTFFPSLFYVVFSTSKHLSVGTFAIVSFMAYSTIIRLESKYVSVGVQQLNSTINMTNPDDDSRLMEAKIRVATSLTFWCGVIQLLMAIFRFGTITKYMSQPLLRGFTTAGTYHILVAQIPFVFGIWLDTHSSESRFFKIFRTCYECLIKITTINYVTLSLSLVSLILLVVIKIFVNEKYKKELRNIPIPIELIVMILGTIVSYFGDLHKRYNLRIIGHIPQGFPTPQIPDFFMLEVIPDAIIISLVTFATSISIADLYARKHKYPISSNKEIFAIGVGNFASSFLKCIPSAGTLARTVVQEESGGRTQLVTIIGDLVVFLVIFYISPLLSALPKACLGAIIISALINLLKQTKDIVYYWKLDKIDFGTWMITFLASVILDIDYGLLLGFLGSFFLNTLRNQKLKLVQLGQVKDYEIHSDIDKFDTREYENTKVIAVTNSLFYANVDEFRLQITTISPLKDQFIEKTLCEHLKTNFGCNNSCKSSKNIERQQEAENNINDELVLESLNNNINNTNEVNTKKDDDLSLGDLKYFKTIILDCTLMTFIDESGVKCLRELLVEYQNEGVMFLLTNCNDAIINFFKKMNCYDKEFANIIYLSVSDAIVSARIY